MACFVRRLAVLLVLPLAAVACWAKAPPPRPDHASALMAGRGFLTGSAWATGGLSYPMPEDKGQSENQGGKPPTQGAAGYSKDRDRQSGSASLVNRPYDSRPQSLGTLLAAAGVPNDHGQLRWPLALRVLPPAPETAELRQQLEAELQLVAAQSLAGRLDPRSVQTANQLADKLQARLADRGYLLASGTYEDGDQFLKRLHKALAALP